MGPPSVARRSALSMSCAIRRFPRTKPLLRDVLMRYELVYAHELRTRARKTRHVSAILPHRCFTVNTHILRSGAGKGYSPIMIWESAKSFYGAFYQSGIPNTQYAITTSCGTMVLSWRAVAPA